MRLPLSLSGLCALSIACGAPAASLAEPEQGPGLMVVREELTAGSISERFTDALEAGESASRGPFAVEPGEKLVVTLAGRGDADLYVRFNSRPTSSSYDCRPYTLHANEQCVLTVPAGATSVYVNIEAVTDSPRYSLVMESIRTGAVPDHLATEPFVIAVLGSSTAEGDGASSLAKSWVGLLSDELLKKANVSIINFASGGYSTLNLLPESGSDGTLDDAIAEHPDLIVISLPGGNDVSAGTPEATYLSRLAEARSTAKEAGIPTFFVGTAPKNTGDRERAQLGDWNTQMQSRFSSCWTPGDAAYSPCFIDVMAALGNADHEIEPEYDSGDGIHLNDAGHVALFQRAEKIIAPYVCEVSGCR